MAGKPRTHRRPQGRRQVKAEPLTVGAILAEALDDTPLPTAARWFGISEAELAAVVSDFAPFTKEMAQTAGTVFGTGAAPWLALVTPEKEPEY